MKIKKPDDLKKIKKEGLTITCTCENPHYRWHGNLWVS